MRFESQLERLPTGYRDQATVWKVYKSRVPAAPTGVPATDFDGPASLRAEWERLACSSTDLRAVYHSPAYFDHLCATTAPGSTALAVARTEAGALRSVVPLVLQNTAYPLLWKGNQVWNIPLQALSVVGGHPTLLPDPGLVRGLLRAVDAAYPSCPAVAMERVPEGNFLADYLREPGGVPNSFLLAIPSCGGTAHHTLPLPTTFEAYQGQFHKKKRYNLNRQVRLFREHCGGIDLRRLESGRDLVPFFEAVAPADGAGPGPIRYDHADLARLRDLAGRNLLRGYVLYHGGIVVASMLGYRHGDTFLLDSIRHHHDYAPFSPGAVLLHLVVQNLIETGAASVINFSDGNPAYSYHATQVLVRYNAVLLLRKNLRNRALLALDRGWQWLKGHWKTVGRP